MNFLNLTHNYFKRRRRIRQAVPIAAAMIAVKMQAQLREPAADVDFDEIAQDAYACVTAIERRAKGRQVKTPIDTGDTYADTRELDGRYAEALTPAIID